MDLNLLNYPADATKDFAKHTLELVVLMWFCKHILPLGEVLLACPTVSIELLLYTFLFSISGAPFRFQWFQNGVYWMPEKGSGWRPLILNCWVRHAAVCHEKRVYVLADGPFLCNFNNIFLDVFFG